MGAAIGRLLLRGRELAALPIGAVMQPPTSHPNELSRPGAARIACLLRCALWPGLEPQHAPAISLGNGLDSARVLSAADLEHGLSRDIVLRARELVQQAGGHVCGQGGGGEEEGWKDEEGAHGRNVAGTNCWSNLPAPLMSQIATAC